MNVTGNIDVLTPAPVIGRTNNLILGRKSPPGEESFYFGKVDGVDRKYRRVIAGIILPVFDRQEGAAENFAEAGLAFRSLYKASEFLGG